MIEHNTSIIVKENTEVKPNMELENQEVIMNSPKAKSSVKIVALNNDAGRMALLEQGLLTKNSY